MPHISGSLPVNNHRACEGEARRYPASLRQLVWPDLRLKKGAHPGARGGGGGSSASLPEYINFCLASSGICNQTGSAGMRLAFLRHLPKPTGSHLWDPSEEIQWGKAEFEGGSA